MTTATAEKRARRMKRVADEEKEIGGAPKPAPAKKRRESAAAVVSSQESEKVEIDEVELVEVKKGRGKSGSVQKMKKATPRGSKKKVDVVPDAGFEEEIEEGEAEEEGEGEVVEKACGSTLKKRKGVAAKKSKKDDEEDSDSDCCFLGNPVPADKAKQRWPERYQKKASITKNGEDDDVVKARCHYLQARVDGCIYNLYDDAYVKAEEGKADYIGRIVEFFEACDNQLYFTAQWFFRAEDTVIKEHAKSHDARRVFLSEEKNDNVLDCIISKVQIVRVAPNIDLLAKEDDIPPCDLYYDMSYSIAYSTFANLPSEVERAGSETSSTVSSDNDPNLSKGISESDSAASTSGQRSELSLLDLYSGCGAMSTGLCLGANLSGVNLQTRWAVDLNPHACQSLKLNHPKTEVRNEQAQDFLALLREWDSLCRRFGLGNENSLTPETDSSDDEEESKDLSRVPTDEFEVGKIVGICYGKTSNLEEVGLKFKVRWKGYGPSDDTWEPIDGLSKCEERIKDFVVHGYKKNILPLPGRVDVICGGPPCQGISGFNRFRNSEAPLEDIKNQQMVVFMDIVDFLKPKFVLMENVVDILKFAGGFLGRYALSRLVGMNYQARMGIMAAGCYGLPQFRMRVFLWGAHPTEKLPQFPLPTHDVVARGGHPTEFEPNVVAFGENQQRQLEKALLLGDAISDLPPVANDEQRDETAYGRPPKTDFQRFIRLTKEELMNQSSVGEKPSQKAKLFDHRPLQLNNDDYLRVCQIPKRKGANFRDLPGVVVGPDNIVEWDPNIERVKLPSGKPLVPDYAMSFIKGKSPKPFGRLWWDETIPTVVTRAEPHNQALLHPEQDRVLTIRENARLQGFPDFYKLCGPVKERYIQVGNAVAVPVSRALGYAFGMAYQRKAREQPVFTLPPKFPQHKQASFPVEAEVVE